MEPSHNFYLLDETNIKLLNNNEDGISVDFSDIQLGEHDYLVYYYAYHNKLKMPLIVKMNMNENEEVNRIELEYNIILKLQSLGNY
jgi:hypothetical protein